MSIEQTIEDRIKHIVSEIESLFGHGHPLATSVVDTAVENGQVAVTDPNPEPGKIADSIAPATVPAGASKA